MAGQVVTADEILRGDVPDVLADVGLPASSAPAPVDGLPSSGRTVPVYDPTGTVGTIPEENLDAAVRAGYKPLSGKEIQVERLREAVREDPMSGLVAGAVGGLKGASFGLAPWLAVKGTELFSGKEKADEVRQALSALDAEHSTLSTGAELLGGALVPTGIIGKGAGAVVSKVAPGLMASAGGRIAAKGIELGLQGATEGALFSTGHQLSEDALGDHETTAEKLFAAAGKGALWGGVIGGGLGLAGGAVSEGIRGVAGKLAERAEGLASKAEGEAIPGLKKTIPEGGVRQVASDLAEEQAWKATGAKMGDELKLRGITPQEVGRTLLDEGIVTGTASKATMAERVAAKAKEVGESLSKLTNKLDTSTVRPSTSAILERARNEVLVPLDSMPGYAAERAAVKGYIDDFERIVGDGWTFSDIRDLRIKLDKKLKFDKVSAPGTVEELRKVRNIIEDEFESAATNASKELGENVARDYATKKELFAKLQTANKILERETARQAGNRAISLTDTIAGVGGLMTGNPLHGLMAAGANKLMREYGNQAAADLLNRASNVDTLRRVASSVDSKLAKGVSDAVHMPAPAESGVRLSKGKVIAIANDVANLASNPAALTERMSKAFTNVSAVAPKTATALAMTTARAVMFLDSKAPKAKGQIATLTPQLDAPKYSDADVAKFAQYLDAVQDPLSVLEDLRRGSISKEGVEAVREVYPKIYEQMRTETMNRLSQLQKPLVYEQRLQLSYLLDIPADPTLTPEFKKAQQARFAQPAQPTPQQPPSNGPNGGYGRKVPPRDTATYQTESERIARQ